MSWRFVAYEKFVFGSTLPAITIGPCMEKPPCLPTILFQAPDQASRSGGARYLEPHHVELLAEPVQSRWPGVADVALEVVLACEGGDRHRRADIEHCDRGGGKRHQNERTPEHALSSLANEILCPREPGRPTRGWRERLNQEAGVTQKERW